MSRPASNRTDWEALLRFGAQLSGAILGGLGLGFSLRGGTLASLAPIFLVPALLALRIQDRLEFTACNVIFGLTFYATAFQGLLGPWQGVFGGIWLMLSAIYTAIHLVFALLIRVVAHKLDDRVFGVLPFAWVAYEYGRHWLTKSYDGCGLTFCLAGQSWVGQDYLRQSADLGGVWLLSFLVALTGSVIASWCSVAARLRIWITIGYAIVMAVHVSYGVIQVRQPPSRLIGHAVTICGRLSAERIDHAVSQMETERPATAKGAWLCFIAPETSMIWVRGSSRSSHDPDQIIQAKWLSLTRDHRCIAIVGAWVRDQNLDTIRNASIVMRNGKVLAIVDKQQPVPFIESQPPGAHWLANRGLIPTWAVSSVRAAQPVPVDAWRDQSIPIVPSVCYDLFFPGTFRNYGMNESDAITCGLDETFDGNGVFVRLSRLHTQLRAVEFRRPVIRSSIEGLSGAWDSAGRSIKPKASSSDVALYEVHGDRRDPIYARFGDWFPIGCFVMVAGFVSLIGSRPTRRRVDNEGQYNNDRDPGHES